MYMQKINFTRPEYLHEQFETIKMKKKKLGKVYLMQTLHSNKDCEGCLKLGGYDSIILYFALLKNKPDKCSFA